MSQVPTTLHGRRAGSEPTYGVELAELLRIMVVAGVPVGFVVAGLGSRIAMGVLRLTSPDYVRGLESDDGFTIGDVTFLGTYQLGMLGAAVGIAGAAAYIAAAPWLIGPSWFRRLTIGVTAGLVVAPLVIHADGIDFNVLEPTWLAIGLFIVVPMLTGVAITFAVDRASRPDAWAGVGARQWVVPVVLVVLTPFSLFALVVVAIVTAALLPLRRGAFDSVRRSPSATWAVRLGFLCFPVLGLVALVRDVAALS